MMVSKRGSDSSAEDQTVFGATIARIRTEYLQAKPPLLQIKVLLHRRTLHQAGTYSNEVVHEGSSSLGSCDDDDDDDMTNPIISQTSKNLYAITVGRTQPLMQPPVQYRIYFVKHVIKQLEALRKGPNKSLEVRSDDEEDWEDPIEPWYNALESLHSLKYQSEPFYRLYEFPRGERNNDECRMIKLFENEAAFVEEGTTGLVTWEASTELAEWLMLPISNPEIGYEPGWIVELGCGCGFLAVAAFHRFPKVSKYIASDGHSNALAKCELNFKANFENEFGKSFQTELIDWQKDQDKFKHIVNNLEAEPGVGMMLGADIVFDPSLIPSLVTLIDIFLETGKVKTVLLSCTIRNETTLDKLKEELGNKDKLRFQIAHSWSNGEIFKISRKAKGS